MYPRNGAQALEVDNDLFYNVNAMQGPPPSHYVGKNGVSPYAERSVVRAGVHGGLGGGARRVPLSAGRPNSRIRFDTSIWFNASVRSKHSVPSGTMKVPYTGEVLQMYHRPLIPGTTHRHKDEPSRTRGRAGRGLQLQRRAHNRRDPKRSAKKMPAQVRSGRVVPFEISQDSRRMLHAATRSMHKSIVTNRDHEGPLRQSDRAGAYKNAIDYRKKVNVGKRFVDPKVLIPKMGGTISTRKQIPAPGGSSSFDKRALVESAQRTSRRTSGAREPAMSVQKRIGPAPDAPHARFGGSAVSSTGYSSRAVVPLRTSGARPPRAPVVGGGRRAAVVTSGAHRSYAGAPPAKMKAAGKGSLRQTGRSAAPPLVAARGGIGTSAAGGALMIKGPPRKAGVSAKRGVRGTNEWPLRAGWRFAECTRVSGPPVTYDNAGRHFELGNMLGSTGTVSGAEVPGTSLNAVAQRGLRGRGASRGVVESAQTRTGSGSTGLFAGETSGLLMQEGASRGIRELHMGKKGAIRGDEKSQDAANAAASRAGASGAADSGAPATARAGVQDGGAASGGQKSRGTLKSATTVGAAKRDSMSVPALAGGAGDGGAPAAARAGVQDGGFASEGPKSRGSLKSATATGVAERAARALPAMADGTAPSAQNRSIVLTEKPKSHSRGGRGAVRVAGPREASVAGSTSQRSFPLIMDSSNGRIKKEAVMPPPLTQGNPEVRERTGANGKHAQAWANATSQAQSRA